jgi:hypothetical protein
VLEAIHSGFYWDTGAHTPGNYAAGWFKGDPGGELRDYFVFDLSNVAGKITDATLRLSTAPPGYIVYKSPDPSETYSLFAVTTPVATLAAGTAGASAFTDLGSGTVYGSLVATPSLGEFADIELEQAGRDALLEADGEIAFGGAITTLTKGSSDEFLFNSTSASLVRRLILTIE